MRRFGDVTSLGTRGSTAALCAAGSQPRLGLLGGIGNLAARSGQVGDLLGAMDVRPRLPSRWWWSARSAAALAELASTAARSPARTRVPVVCLSGGAALRIPGAAGTYPAELRSRPGTVKVSPSGPS